jgi:ketosteroid isomerase-like protein
VTAREVIGEYPAAMQRGDRDTALSSCAEDVLIRIPGRSPIAGERFARAGAALEIERANVCTVRDGAIVEIWIFEADQHAVDELLA